LFFNLLGN